MNQETLAKLTEPFARQQVKQRKGNQGRSFDYLETHSVISRLNDSLAADWSFEIVDHRIMDSEVVVIGKLTVHSQPEITKTAFGSQQIKRYEQSGEIICIGDDLKAAQSDCLKKAATLLGVGLELYDRSSGNGARPAHNGHQQQRPGNGGHHGNGGNGRHGSNGGNGNGSMRNPDEPLTVKQMKCLYSMAKRAGMNANALNVVAKQSYGKNSVDDLTKQEASELISSLQASQ